MILLVNLISKYMNNKKEASREEDNVLKATIEELETYLKKLKAKTEGDLSDEKSKTEIFKEKTEVVKRKAEELKNKAENLKTKYDKADPEKQKIVIALLSALAATIITSIVLGATSCCKKNK
ncbi:hypothetical protein C0583_01510 [Candidatus Parcubacteria bacterium]|nr:MAG: hypothetical protein C0583_01510 [Candidatus Parcubacteria bacterium]